MNQSTRKQMAGIADSLPIQDDLPNQKFLRGQRVKVSKSAPNIYKDCEAIVEYSYSQKYSVKSGFGTKENAKSYCLLIIEDKKPINSVSWYEEEDLALVDKDVKKG